MIRRTACLAVCFALATVHAAVAQTTATFVPLKDNTIWDAQLGQYNSNGAGQYLFAGVNNADNRRRALIQFDLSTIPAGSTVSQVSLRLHVSRARANNDPASLHRLNADWGEGASNADGEEGLGAPPEPGDATWIHRFYNTALWAQPGADFDPTPSATIVVSGQNGFYTWSGSGLVGDVQAWVDGAALNRGWLLVGNEADLQTVMRLDSRENPTAANRPQLTVVYTPPAGLGACCLPDSTCATLLQADCVALGGTFLGEGTSCTPNPCGGTITVELTPGLDNTLYEVAAGGSALSNGQGAGFFAGGGDMPSPTYRRRGVLAFDLSALPPGALVTDASLRMYLGFTQDSTARLVSLHAAAASWGEGASLATGNQTNGAPAQPGDATWLRRFFDTTSWASPGGDFDSPASATTTVGTATGTFHTWTGTGLIGDVQQWISVPSSNFGWVVVSDAETTRRSQRRFDTGESAVSAQRPTLTVTYALPTEPVGACCLPSGQCVELTSSQCLAQGGDYRGDDTLCAEVSCALVLEPFVDPLPLPYVATPVSGVPGGTAHYEIEVREVMQQFHRDLPLTRVWGYDASYPGPTIEARTGLPVTVVWKNQLRVFENQQLRTEHALAVDTCLHGPDVTGSVPVIVTHLHGGHVPADSDGYPEFAFPPGQDSPLYTYPNIQPAGTIWYHDHALGITRLNVYMGLAGYYIIRDDAEDALNLPRDQHEVPLAIQDRSFNLDGSLLYPEMWMEHFFGDFIVVNGKVWPYLNVDRGKYRFRVLNGSGSRAYRLALSNGATFWQIGTDSGLMGAPVPLTELTITPGERADIVVDFAPFAPGTEIVLTNDAPVPFPAGEPSSAIPNVLKFVVQDAQGHTAPLPGTLVAFEPIPESQAVVDRPFELRRSTMAGPDCPPDTHRMWMINDLMWDDITEFPRLGTTEIWSWINRSSVSHPMHMHLVSFQVLDRQSFVVVGGVIVPVGDRVAPAPNEIGWKDTVQATPNQITRVIARFENFAGLFPYHCHILEHEDHEMMRQFETVCPAPSITDQPDSTQADPGATAQFTVAADGYRLEYRWRRAGVDLFDGPSGTGSTISGAATPTLIITGVTPGDAGAYDSAITSPCGNVTTSTAELTVCRADFNHDGVVNSTDVSDFINAWFEDQVFGTLVTDWDHNGVVNSTDVSDFINAWFEDQAHGCG